MAQLGRSPGASLALWLHLRRHALAARAAGAADLPLPPPPPGAGALLLVHVAGRGPGGGGAEGPGAEPLPLSGIVQALRARRPGLRIAVSGLAPAPPAGAGQDPAPPLAVSAPAPPAQEPVFLGLPRDPSGVERLLRTLDPGGLLILGDELPAALIAGCAERRIPVVLAQARLARPEGAAGWRGAVNRALVARLDRILAADLTAAAAARRLGADPGRIELTGPITETLAPLPANEAERAALAQILRGRHVWLAAAPTLPEVTAVLAAHHAMLQHNHRALLILAGLPEALLPAILAEAERLALPVVLRSEDEDPAAEDHVLIAEDPHELGLWYRLSPVSFMGGTLLPGPGLAPRHPFEPAALGSAIIHGPLAGAHAAEWSQLDGAAAARLVMDADALARAVAELTAPDQAAMLAGNAWAVSTGGAAVLRRIADAVIDAMEAAP